jgi:RimJ/RimL family protein N-acetyltransferase
VTVLQTDRLRLRELTTADAGFILRLVNEPGWLRFIGDRGVRTLADARGYIANGPMASYARLGFGLWLVVMRATGEPIGLCGLLKRETLAEVDIGFAFLEAFGGQGYAFEAASAVMAYAGRPLGLARVVAVSDPDNLRSIKLLAKLGMRFAGRVRLSDSGPELAMYISDLSPHGTMPA